MEKNMTYASAITRLNTIVSQLEQGTLDIDKLSECIKEAQELLAFCKEKLTKVETDVNKILSNDEQK